MVKPKFGYAGRILRVNLIDGTSSIEEVDEQVYREYIGGAALGIKYLYDNVPAETNWDDPENIVFIGAGPVSGSSMRGSGCVAVVTQGALTNGIASSQAGGYFAAFMRHSGYDAVAIEGKAPELSYLVIGPNGIEIRNAEHLSMVDAYDTNDKILDELGKKVRQACVMAIGPAGENLVRFACVSVDKGHMAAHNGIGAVFGTKNLKAVVALRAPMKIKMYDKSLMAESRKNINEFLMNDFLGKQNLEIGTGGGVPFSIKVGIVPCHNFKKNTWDCPEEEVENYTTPVFRKKHNAKLFPCWACNSTHCHELTLSSGPWKGMEIEEPEYESMAAFSAVIDVFKADESLALFGFNDRYGMDANEMGYILGWLMECYEKGALTKDDLDGLEFTWGNSAAVAEMIRKIAFRDGIGDLLAEGVKRASAKIGKGTENWAVYTMKGNTPRTHDHRVMWIEHFDTCVSSVGTIETHPGSYPAYLLGEPAKFNAFDHMTIPYRVAKGKGCTLVEDSVTACRFQTGGRLELITEAIKGATGWMDYTWQDAQEAGRRACTLARIYGFRKGIYPNLDWPGPRYGSVPQNGASEGVAITEKWPEMLKCYYENMDWDENGFPTEKALNDLNLGFAVDECNFYREIGTPIVKNDDHSWLMELYKTSY